MDYGRKEWPDLTPINPVPWNPWEGTPLPVTPVGPVPDLEALKKFRKLVETAKEFDEAANQPDCEDPEKIKFLEAVEARIKLLEDRKASKHVEVLLGSSILESTYTIAGKTVQLGDIVRRAHGDSGLSVDAWNALEDNDRERRLSNAVIQITLEMLDPVIEQALKQS